MSEQHRQYKSNTTKKDIKPSGFGETEKLAKNLMNAKGDSYFQWLHNQHKDIILNFTLENQDKMKDILN